MALLSEYMLRGSVEPLLPQLLPHRRLRIARDVAAGMQFLHGQVGEGHAGMSTHHMASTWRHTSTPPPKEPKIAHGNLQLKNVYLNGSWVAKIVNYGLAKLKASGTGMEKYKAPELIPSSGATSPVCHATDVYSYGIMMWELLMKQIAFGKQNVQQVTLGWMIEQFIVLLPKGNLKKKYNYHHNCCKKDHSELSSGWAQPAKLFPQFI